jgi:dTDP-4-dehydrorhamnose 3,5-epimerase
MSDHHDPELLQQLFLRLGYSQHHREPLQVPAPPVTPRPSGCDLRRLRWHLDVRGALCELHRTTWAGHPIDPVYRSEGSVGQVYTSTTRPGVVKGWHVHSQQTDRFICVRGAVLVALCDVRPLLHLPATTVETVVLDSSRGLHQLTIPPGVVHGWRALDHSDGEAWVLNVCSHLYDGTDEYRIGPRCQPAPGTDFDWWAPIDG